MLLRKFSLVPNPNLSCFNGAHVPVLVSYLGVNVFYVCEAGVQASLGQMRAGAAFTVAPLTGCLPRRAGGTGGTDFPPWG